MGLINIYDTISNKSETVKANGKLKDILPEINFNHSLILKAGNRLSADYEVTEEDVLYIRKIPAAVSATVLAGIAIGVSVLAIGVGVGAGIYANKKAEEAQKEMEKAQKNAQNLASQTQQLPFIRGAKNTSALGEAVQFLMGEVYNTPYKLSDGFYTIDGEDGKNSYFTSVFSCGYNSQKVKKILIGNEALITNNSGISGKHNIDSDSIYYNSEEDNYVEVKGPGEDFTSANWNYKVKSAYSGAELKHDYGEDAEPVIVQAADNAYKIQVCIQFSALRSYNTESSVWEERTATVRPYWSNNGGETWNEFTFAGSNQNTFEKNKNTNIRYVATKEFSAAESFGKNISIKVVKETPKAESNTQEDCYLLWHQTFCYDAEQSTASELVPCKLLNDELNDKVTKIGYQFIANDNTNDILDELHCITAAEARIYENGSWSNTKSETRNPAAWLLEVLTSSVHDASRYDDEELYLPSFGALYDYCAENDFFCDGIISTSDKKRDVIEKILKLCNSTLILNNDGLLEVVTDKEEQNPVALLNSENIVSFSFSKSMARKTDGTKVTFTNRNTWTVDTFYSMLDGQEYDYESDTVDSLAIDYVTDDTHAYKVAQRQLRQRQMQNREVKVDVGHEGDFYPLYSTVLLQLPQLLQGLNSSVIRRVTKYNNTITKIAISDLVEFQANKTYGVIIQATNDYGYKLYSAQVTGNGSTRELIFPEPLPLEENTIIPTVGNHLSFGLIEESGNFSKITNVMKIYGIEPNGKDGYSLTLRDYDPEVYEYSPSGVIPEHKSNLTLPIKKRGGVTLDQMLELRGQMDSSLSTEMATMQAKLAALYSNRIITLYKTVAGEISTTGIATTLTYNFSNNQAVWGDSSLANGWSTEVPQDLTNVWITTATAYGKSITDVINANEWARPVPYSASGYNTVTINLYKRLSMQPVELPANVTYRFDNASTACSNWNGWSLSIPATDEDKTPCWEIHATALSTSATDVIETNEWSEPVQIFTEGFSRQEILDMIGERQNETPNVMFSPNAGVFALDEDGVTSRPQTAYMDVRVVQNEEDIDFTFGQINLPSGMTVSASTSPNGGQRLTFTVAQGVRLRDSVIEIPIQYVRYLDYDVFVDELGNPLVWIADENGRWYGNYHTVESLPTAVTGGFILFDSDVDVTASEEIVSGGVFYAQTYYTYNGTKWAESEVVPFGMKTEATSSDTYTISYSVSTVVGGRYAGKISSVASIPTDSIIGDYFAWVGADNTPYEGSGFTQLKSGIIYKWNGQQYEKDNTGRHQGTALPDLLQVAEAELAQNNSDVILSIKKMIAWETVTENLKVTGSALINSTITAELVLGKKPNSEEYGYFISENYSEVNNTGFKLDGNGKAVLNEVVVRGDVYAKSLILGQGVTIGASGIDGLSSVATSGSYSDLSNKPTIPDVSKLATSTSVTHKTENGVEKVTVTTTKQDGTTSTSTTAVIDQGDYLYLTKDYGTASEQHNAPHLKISKQGLLEADNAIIYGTIYATNGEFSGELKSATGKFSGTLESTSFSLGSSGYKLDPNGMAYVNQLLAPYNINMPNFEIPEALINSVSIDLNKETASSIKNKLDSLISSYGKKSFEGIDVQYVFCNIISDDETKLNVVSSIMGYTEKIAHYLARYKSSSDGYVYYSIGSRSVFERKILRTNEDGSNLIKYTSSEASNLLKVLTRSDGVNIYGDLLTYGHISSMFGYKLTRIGYQSVNTPIKTVGQAYEVLSTIIMKDIGSKFSIKIESESGASLIPHFPIDATIYQLNLNTINMSFIGINGSYAIPTTLSLTKDSTDSIGNLYFYV